MLTGMISTASRLLKTFGLRKIELIQSRILSNNGLLASQSAGIYALSSGFGKCGVAVIRISGKGTQSALLALGRKQKLPRERHAVIWNLYHPETQLQLDQGLVLWFKGPQSFTGEDVCELQVHGGPAVVTAILDALSCFPALRPAQPGEFTKRAFAYGKLDLVEVEGLGDLIHAETEAQRRQALRQMQGELSAVYGSWRQRLLKCVANAEAYIDFSEDDNIEDDVLDEVLSSVKQLRVELERHLADKRRGERLRSGVSVAIVGQPNVGKSSLLNVITRRDSAIVSSVAGTTRDVIERTLDLGGYPLLLCDTAGLRKSDDAIEQEGVQRARNTAAEADILIVVMDVYDVTRLAPPTSDLVETNKRTLEEKSNFMKNSQSKQIMNLDATINQHISDLGIDRSSHCDVIVVLNKSDLMFDADRKKLKHLGIIDTNPDISAQGEVDKYELNENSNKRSGSVKETYSYVPSNNSNLDSNKDSNPNDNSTPSNVNSKSLDFNQSRESTNPHKLEISQSEDTSEPHDLDVCIMSCATREGVHEFLATLTRKLKDMCDTADLGTPSLTQARHRAHLTRCLDHLGCYDDWCQRDIVLATEHLRKALRQLGKVTGNITSEEILDVIFRDFCIGK